MTTVKTISGAFLVALLHFWAVSVQASAQNITAELLLLQNRYSSLQRYSVSMTYKAFKGHTSQTVADLQPGKFEMWDNQKRFVMGNTEIIQNGSYLIQLDHEIKEMDIAKPVAQSGIPAFGNFTELEPLLRKHNALFFKAEANDIHLLVFDLKKSGEEYEKIELRYKATGEITSIVLFYRAKATAYGSEEDYKPRVEIQYRDQNFSAYFEPDHFSEKKFFLIQNNVPVPQPAFKHYKIFDAL